MHIRVMTKGAVAKASIQEQLDIITYILSIIDMVQRLIVDFNDKRQP